MSTNIFIKNAEEIREENEYYRPYDTMLQKIDKVSGLRTPPIKRYPVQIDSLDEVAIDVIGNIENQLDFLKNADDKITIDLWECIPETLGYNRNLEDGNLLTKAIYLVSTEITSLLVKCRRKKKAYYDAWHIDDNGHVCIDIIKNPPQISQPSAYSLHSGWAMTDHNIKTFQALIMPEVVSAVDNHLDMRSCAREKKDCTIQISSLLSGSREALNLYHTITHGLSMIIYLRNLQLHLHEATGISKWFVSDTDDGADLFLSMKPIN